VCALEIEFIFSLGFDMTTSMSGPELDFGDNLSLPEDIINPGSLVATSDGSSSEDFELYREEDNIESDFAANPKYAYTLSSGFEETEPGTIAVSPETVAACPPDDEAIDAMLAREMEALSVREREDIVFGVHGFAKPVEETPKRLLGF
jgi:hypothetical protein